jgi:radical SAM-linked protein
VRLWERAIRRGDIPVAYTEGFNPRQKLSFGPPLSLGLTSECELIDLYLEKWSNPDGVAEELNKTLPAGINILEARNIFSDLPAITATITTAEYTADFEGDIKNKIAEILNSKEIIAERKNKTLNIRPMIKDLTVENGKIKIMSQCDSYGALKGSEIHELLKGYSITNIRRIKLLFF